MSVVRMYVSPAFVRSRARVHRGDRGGGCRTERERDGGDGKASERLSEHDRPSSVGVAAIGERSGCGAQSVRPARPYQRARRGSIGPWGIRPRSTATGMRTARSLPRPVETRVDSAACRRTPATSRPRRPTRSSSGSSRSCTTAAPWSRSSRRRAPTRSRSAPRPSGCSTTRWSARSRPAWSARRRMR